MTEEKVEVEMFRGIIAWFSNSRGFGFIEQDHSEVDIFLHYSNLSVDGFKTVQPGDRVSYEIGENHKGAQAVNVVVTGKAEPTQE